MDAKADLADRVLEFITHHGGWNAALDYVKRLEVENRLRRRAVERWVPCPDHRDKTDEGRCYVCENERLTRQLADLAQAQTNEGES